MHYILKLYIFSQTIHQNSYMFLSYLDNFVGVFYIKKAFFFWGETSQLCWAKIIKGVKCSQSQLYVLCAMRCNS
jgi:hypothetical protein